MLRPETARSILHTLLAVLFVGAGLALVLTVVVGVLILVNGDWPTSLSLELPVHLALHVGEQVYDISGTSLLVRRVPAVALCAFFLLALGLSVLLLFGLRRLRGFVDRVLEDPFHADNSRDLRLAAQLALGWQVILWALSAALWLWSRHADLAAPLRRALADVPGIGVSATGGIGARGGVQVLGVDFTPLIFAAALSVLATVFQRGHDLREAERRLRAEQELTV